MNHHLPKQVSISNQLVPESSTGSISSHQQQNLSIRNLEPIEIRSSDKCYELNPGSSVRVRFRMITHQSHHHSSGKHNRRIHSTASSSISTASSSVIHSPDAISPDLTAPLPVRYQKNYQKEMVSYCDNGLVQHTPPPAPCIIYNKYVNQNNQQNMHINIGKASGNGCTSGRSSSSTTTRTFKLTEDLKSNIRFDITLKPSLSIRDNRIDPSLQQTCSTASTSSNGSARSNHCFSNPNPPRSTSCDMNRNAKPNNQIELPINTCNNLKNGSNSNTGGNHVPLNSSITFKIKNIELNDSNEMDSNKRIGANKRNYCRYNSQSPFTFIETYSARRGISLSPNSINERNLNNSNRKVTILAVLILMRSRSTFSFLFFFGGRTILFFHFIRLKINAKYLTFRI